MKRLVPRVCDECLKLPCECNKELREQLEEQIEVLYKKKEDIIQKELNSLQRYGFYFGVFDCDDEGDFVKYEDVKKLLEKL